jgi:hypothetical protein
VPIRARFPTIVPHFVTIRADLLPILLQVLAIIAELGSFFGGGIFVAILNGLPQILSIFPCGGIILTKLAHITIALAAILIQFTTIGTNISPVMSKFPSVVTNILAIALSYRWYGRRVGDGDGLPKRK